MSNIDWPAIVQAFRDGGYSNKKEFYKSELFRRLCGGTRPPMYQFYEQLTGVSNLPSFNPVQIAKLEKSSQTEFAQPRFEAYPPKPNLQPAKPQPFVLVKITLASGTTLEFSTPDPEGFALRLAGVAG